jgi:glyoxylase-like metal-dependent hydrolase (beta-lactamase superfamily II)
MADKRVQATSYPRAPDPRGYLGDGMDRYRVITINSTNYFFIPCNDGFLLIDAGWVGTYERFKRELERQELGLDSVRYILLTHHHHDHVALVRKIRDDVRCKVIVHEHEVQFIAKGVTHGKETKQYNFGLTLLDRIMSPFVEYNYDPIVLNHDDIIIGDDDCDIHNLTGIHGSIIHTPGHSKGSVSLLLEDGCCFVGDLAMNVLKVFGQEHRPIEAESYPDIYRSWSKVIQKGARVICPSHGSRFPAEALTRILATT